MAGPVRKWIFTWEGDHAWINTTYPASKKHHSCRKQRAIPLLIFKSILQGILPANRGVLLFEAVSGETSFFCYFFGRFAHAVRMTGINFGGIMPILGNGIVTVTLGDVSNHTSLKGSF